MDLKARLSRRLSSTKSKNNRDVSPGSASSVASRVSKISIASSSINAKSLFGDHMLEIINDLFEKSFERNCIELCL